MAAEEFDIQKRYEKKKEEERKKEKGIVDDKKKIVQIIKLEVPAGAAKPGPPIGPVLGQHQLNTAEFCKEFNKLTEKIEQGVIVPVLIFKKADRTFEIKLKTPTTTFYRTKFEKVGKKNTKGRFSSADVFVSVISPKIESVVNSDMSLIINNEVKDNKKLEKNVKTIKTILSSLRSAKLRAVR
jgi:large subunit ribosomal protein L11